MKYFGTRTCSGKKGGFYIHELQVGQKPGACCSNHAFTKNINLLYMLDFSITEVCTNNLAVEALHGDLRST